MRPPEFLYRTSEDLRRTPGILRHAPELFHRTPEFLGHTPEPFGGAPESFRRGKNIQKPLFSHKISLARLSAILSHRMGEERGEGVLTLN